MYNKKIKDIAVYFNCSYSTAKKIILDAYTNGSDAILKSNKQSYFINLEKLIDYKLSKNNNREINSVNNEYNKYNNNKDRSNKWTKEYIKEEKSIGSQYRSMDLNCINQLNARLNLMQ